MNKLGPSAFLLSVLLFYTDGQLKSCLLCRRCGHEIVPSDLLFDKPSKQALRQRNDTILEKKEVLIQLFENPNGMQFELITSTFADISKGNQIYTAFSWFADYAWRMAMCSNCGYHLGWFYERVGTVDNDDKADSKFIGLILSHLIQPDFADSLIVIPKSYYS